MATATYQFTPPERFNFSNPTDWTKWFRRFERFSSASGLAEQSGEKQVNTLIYTMGTEADEIFDSFGLSVDEKKVYETVVGKFDNHFVKRKNVIYERAVFNKRMQEEGESVEVFITALHAQAEKCEYGGLREEMIRDRVVVGIRDAAVSLKLQLDSALTLEKAVTQARDAEAVKKQQRLLRGDKTKDKPENFSQVHSVEAAKPFSKGRGKQHRPHPKQATSTKGCYRCGRTTHQDRQSCPARDAECHKCGKRGHFKAM